ncbi:DUF4393 domain-containing protein [Candidatus Pacearchaeota archaeon]|nr:DUF4393 domain-containing protein [Candidatus Pacearchaeota archaeon]
MAEKVGGFLTAILGDACKEIGGTVHDWTKLYRYKNLLRIQDKVEQIKKDRKSEGKSIPIEPAIGIPLIEAASVVEDDNLQQKWATLIANATSPKYNEKIRKSYISILSSLDPYDAKILERMNSQGWNNDLGKINTGAISENTNIEETEVRISLSNLSRLGLVDIGTPITAGGSTMNSVSNESVYKISLLGWQIIKVCS